MIAVLAVELGVAPQSLWDADPRDLATVVDVLTERAAAVGRGRR
jgi:hypothetical protein